MKKTLSFFIGILLMIYGIGFISSCSDDDEEEFTSSVTGIQLNMDKLELTEQDVDTLIARILPDNAPYASVVWISNADSIATVNDFGVITAVKAGEAIITANIFGKTITAECAVTVTKRPIPIKKLKLDTASVILTCYDGKWDTLQLNPIIKPTNATIELLWTSSDEGVATVSPEGLIRAVAQGEAVIRCMSANDESHRDSCKVRVVREKGVISVKFLEVDDVISLKEGNVKELSAEILPLNAEDKTVTWTSSDPSVVDIEAADQLTAKITALKEGEATVVLKSNDGGFSDTCKILVRSSVVKVTDLSGLPKTLNGIVGKSETLSVNVLPTDATNKTIHWKSSNESVAIVQAGSDSQKAIVTYLQEGKVSIIATSQDNPQATMSCTITVKKEDADKVAVTHLSGLPETRSGTVGKNGVLSVTVNPTNATNKTVIWESSDESIATVRPYNSGSQNATVTYLKEGTVTITATSEDNSKATMSCKITVRKDESGGNVAVERLVGPFTDPLNVSTGKKSTFQVIVIPSKATNKNVIWKSSDESIAIPKPRASNSAIADITWLKAGTVTITATSESNPEVMWSGVVIVQ